MKRLFSFLILLSAVALVSVSACLIVQHYVRAKDPGQKPELFSQLNLSAEQEQKINAIREKFAANQHQCMVLMQQRNRELADAIISDRADSPRVQAAVEKIHEAMGDMQKATLMSIFAAKEVLTPEQYDQLLHLVAKQLSTPETAPCCR